VNKAKEGADQATEEGGSPTIEVASQEFDVEGLQGVDERRKPNQSHSFEVGVRDFF